MRLRFVPVICLLLLVGCAKPLQRIPALTTVTGVDLSRYTARGFFFSTDAYPGNHETMGLVVVTSYAEATPIRLQAEMMTAWRFTPVAIQVVLDTVYARAVVLGADAFVKMEIRSVTTGTNPVVPGLEVSGVAIRRSAR